MDKHRQVATEHNRETGDQLKSNSSRIQNIFQTIAYKLNLYRVK